jgi:hypothetical protein
VDFNYQKSTEFTPTSEDIAEFKQWKVTGPSKAIGMIKAGNIDLTKRPVVHNADGSVSTLLSMSFGTEDGEILIPKVSPDGKILSDQAAKKRYLKTKEMLGIFKTPENADHYADLLHRKQGAFQTWKNGGMYKPSVETWNK